MPAFMISKMCICFWNIVLEDNFMICLELEADWEKMIGLLSWKVYAKVYLSYILEELFIVI